MRELIELIGLVTSELPSKREFINSVHARNDQNIVKLYKGIKSGSFKTDSDAAKHIYSVEPSHKKYLMLKMRLMRKLTNSLFFFDQSQSKLSGYHKAVFRCNKQYFICRMLLSYGARSIAHRLLKALTRDAEKYRIYEVMMLSSRYLSTHYSLTGNKKLFDHFVKKFEYAHDEFSSEILSVRYFDEIQMEFAGNALPRNVIVKRIESVIAELTPVVKKRSSFNLHFNYARLCIISNLLQRNYSGAILHSKKAIVYLESNPVFYQRLGVAELNRTMLECYVHQRKFSKGEESAALSKSLIVTGSNNWFRFMETYFLIKIQSKNYSEALSVFNNVTSHPRFDKQAGPRNEIWDIYFAYLNILYEGGLLEDLTSTKRFNIYKFLNSVPTYSKDKFGFNLTILIAQFSLLIIRGDMDEALNKLEGFRNYRYRYLKAKNNYERSNRFLNTLFLLCRYSYDLTKVKKILADKKSLKTLTDDTPFAQIEMVEILPYEVLMDVLTKKILSLSKL
jgi:hypothetical protein